MYIFRVSSSVQNDCIIFGACVAARFISASNSVVVDQSKKQISLVQQRNTATGETCHQGTKPRVMKVLFIGLCVAVNLER